MGLLALSVEIPRLVTLLADAAINERRNAYNGPDILIMGSSSIAIMAPAEGWIKFQRREKDVGREAERRQCEGGNYQMGWAVGATLVGSRGD